MIESGPVNTIVHLFFIFLIAAPNKGTRQHDEHPDPLTATRGVFMNAPAPERKAVVTVPQMTPDQFKAEIQRKGWTFKAVAERWGVSPNWVSKLARNNNRALHWDDAVRGLPMLG
ncbi:helix-turn-helix domain-containing protein (plasmid) [Xanthomonas citri pv. phaseoli var. fuscans]|nr:helix-turn-helix domain-containing protein [Xanthomonas citri pv. phaseoli var. fuscans]